MHKPLCLSVATLVAVAMASVAPAQDFIVHGELVCATDSDLPILDTSVRERFNSTIPGCVKKLLVLTQCYGGEFLDEFALTSNVAIASATSPGELSYYGWYEQTAAFSLRHEAGRTAADLHTEATINAKIPFENPSIGGAMSLDAFPLDRTSPALQQKLHILYYAGRPEQPGDFVGDLSNYLAIRENNPNADIVVVSSGILASVADFPSTQNGFAMAMETIGSRMVGCDHLFVLFLSDHGEISFVDVPRDADPGSNEFTTPALPPPIGPALHGTPDARPIFVIFVPLYGTGTTVDPNGPALFAPGAWQISVPLLPGTFVSSDFVQIPIGGEDGVVGDDPGDGIRLEFEMPVDAFINAFVGHTNVVTITNNTGQFWNIEISLDPGPIRMGVPPTCGSPDFDGDGDVGTDADIEAFLACLGGNCCASCGSADFDQDGDTGTDADVESFFRVLGGGAC